jgi:hypothetical protein
MIDVLKSDVKFKIAASAWSLEYYLLKIYTSFRHIFNGFKINMAAVRTVLTL